jgi:hypothetical protein
MQVLNQKNSPLAAVNQTSKTVDPSATTSAPAADAADQKNVFKSSIPDSLQLGNPLDLANCNCDCPPVAANEDASMWSDPHITEPDGGDYKVQPQGYANLLTDKNVTLIGKFDKATGKSGATLMKEAGLTVRDSKIDIKVDGTVNITGKDGTTNALTDGQTVMLDDYNVIKREGNIVTVTTPEYRMKFAANQKVQNQSKLNGQTFVRVDIHSKEDGVMKDGQAPTGLLGETFDEDKKKQTKPKFALSTYKTDSLFPGASTAVQADQAAGGGDTTPDDADCYCPPEAPGEHARMWGDPHLNGADGESYDVQAKGITNILSDHGIEMNANTVGKQGGPGWHNEIGLTLRDNTVNVKADGTVTIGHKDGTSTALADGQTVMLDDYNAIKKEGNLVTVLSQEYKLQFTTQQKSKMKDAPKGMQFINTDLWSKDMGVKSDGTDPSGLLGETFDADKIKQKKPKFDISTYRRDSLLSVPQAQADVATPNTTPLSNPVTSPVKSSAFSQALQDFLAKYGQ